MDNRVDLTAPEIKVGNKVPEPIDNPVDAKEMAEKTEKARKQYAFPTDRVELPSGGLLYPEGHPLAEGYVEIKHMTAKEEDILTTESYIRDDIVIDMLLKSLLVTEFNYNDLLLGDKNAIIIAARINGYGEVYKSKVLTPKGKHQEVQIDLKTIGFKELSDVVKNNPHKNVFTFTTPSTKDEIKFRLLTVGDLEQIKKNSKSHKTIGSRDRGFTSRLNQMFISVNGNDDKNFISMYVETMLARDARAFRQYLTELTPDVDIDIEVIDEETREPFRSKIEFGASLFWPDAGV